LSGDVALPEGLELVFVCSQEMPQLSLVGGVGNFNRIDNNYKTLILVLLGVKTQGIKFFKINNKSQLIKAVRLVK